MFNITMMLETQNKTTVRYYLATVRMTHQKKKKKAKKRKLTDIESRLVVAKEGWWGREVGISRCKLFYRYWINNKVLLYSSGNYNQYPVINHQGKEYEIECVYIYV